MCVCAVDMFIYASYIDIYRASEDYQSLYIVSVCVGIYECEQDIKTIMVRRYVEVVFEWLRLYDGQVLSA